MQSLLKESELETVRCACFGQLAPVRTVACSLLPPNGAIPLNTPTGIRISDMHLNSLAAVTDNDDGQWPSTVSSNCFCVKVFTFLYHYANYMALHEEIDEVLIFF